MGKEKKITVKPFFNKAVNPKILQYKTPGYYPLYFQVTYDRKTTRFSGGDRWFPLSEEKSVLSSPLVTKSTDQIKDVIRYLSNQYDDFEIKGIGTMIRCFATQIIAGIYVAIADDVDNKLYTSLSHDEYDNWKFSGPDYIENGIAMLGDKLGDDLAELMKIQKQVAQSISHKVTVYDWVLGGVREDQLTKGKGSSKSEITEIVDVIDEAIEKILYHGAESSIYSKTDSYDGIAELYRIVFP